MTSHSDARPNRSRFPGWFVALALVLGYVAWDSIAVSRQILETSAEYGVTVDAPPLDPHSSTGYAQGRRSLLLPAGEADTAHWIMQTQAMLDRGEARIRHVNYDNAPSGREVHWAAPFHWWLAALAWIDRGVSGRPLGIAVERATLTSGPVMLGLLLIGLTPFLSRRFSPWAAGLVAVGSVAMYPFYLDFVPARADHHGIANICCLFTVLFLLLGSASPVGGTAAVAAAAAEFDSRATRRWFVASGIAGGLGLWISAATAAPVLIFIGLAILAASGMSRSSAARLSWLREPALLRLWGWAGGGTSLVAYLIEYLPSHLGMRLEVNHPLYAIAWVGAGEALRVAMIALGNDRHLSRRDQIAAALGSGAVVLLPAVIWLTQAKTFTVADPFVWRLHSLYISEFQGLRQYVALKGFGWGTLAYCLPIGWLVPPAMLLFRAGTTRELKAQILLVGLPALGSWAMGWNQVRWLSLAYAVSIPLVAVFFRAIASPRDGKISASLRWSILGGVLLLPGTVQALQRTSRAAESTQGDIRSLAERDVAHWLRLRGGNQRVVVAGAPMTTTKLISFGGFSGLGTLYWENADGLKNAGAFFAATTPESARAMAQRLGITHIVLFSWDAFEVLLARLWRGLPNDAPIPADLFIANLLKASIPPPWLRAIPFKLPAHPSLAGDQVRVWEVVTEQPPAEAVAHAANYYLELGVPEIAAQFAPALANYQNELPAMVMLTGLAARNHDAATFATASRRVTALLGRANALPLDDHIALVVVLVVGEQLDFARAQLEAGMRKMDEASLRHLTTGTLSDLLALSEALSVEFPTPELKRLAQQLVPPSKRK